MATGCVPDALMGGGRDYFDALVEQVGEERQNGWITNELLATLIEVEFAQYRILLALAGSKDIPRQIRVPRPGDGRHAAAAPRAHWQDIARMMGQH